MRTDVPELPTPGDRAVEKIVLDGAVTASVVVPCFNESTSTRCCLASLFRHTRPSWELIAIDNGSTDDTAAYLEGLRDAAPGRVRLIANPENRGFPAACNQGLALARGNYLVLLNNDVVVTDAWLEMLVALADSDPKIGMVGPMSNEAPPPQRVESVPYGDLDAMHHFASRWRAEHRGRWFTVPKLSGFCVLIKRAAFEVVGGLDEQLGLGLFDDLALRMRRAGYELAVANDLFVHHSGSRTFAGAGIDTGRRLAENRTRFEAKCGAEVPRPREVALTPRVGFGAALRPREGEVREGRRKIFGIGLPRTGTTSLAAAMMELGRKTCHACFDDALFDRGDAFFDTPVYADYRHLDRRYPGSKYILTWREPRSWFASFSGSLGGYLHRLRTRDDLPPDNLVDRRCYAQVFGSDVLSEGPFVARYREHRRQVEAYFADRPGDLLILELAVAADPWDELCGFLDLVRPATPFPRLNAGGVDYWKKIGHANKL
jgi:O-antigen biosynthesis protein